jgi:hypothetical protein
MDGPTMWRGHSCLPRRDSSRRFSPYLPLRWQYEVPWPATFKNDPKSVERSLDAADTSVRATSWAHTHSVTSGGQICVHPRPISLFRQPWLGRIPAPNRVSGYRQTPIAPSWRLKSLITLGLRRTADRQGEEFRGRTGCSGPGDPSGAWPAAGPGRPVPDRRQWPACHSRARLCGTR